MPRMLMRTIEPFGQVMAAEVDWLERLAAGHVRGRVQAHRLFDHGEVPRQLRQIVDGDRAIAERASSSRARRASTSG